MTLGTVPAGTIAASPSQGEVQEIEKHNCQDCFANIFLQLPGLSLNLAEELFRRAFVPQGRTI